MNKSKIEWCDYTWNPVTGCLHGCDYCYARRIARRFCHDPWNTVEDRINHFVGLPMQNEFYKGSRIDPYPYGFDPTFHRYRLNEPQQVKKSSKIFVVSMGDLFGEWVPDSWIEEVFKACEAAPQHTYMFLTKNPKRYTEILNCLHLPFENRIINPNSLENIWFGTTITKRYASFEWLGSANKFLSIEPLLAPVTIYFNKNNPIDWVIVGAQTGPGAVPPKPEWVQSIIDQCRAAGVPVFLKNNLNWPEKIQEWPDGMK